MQPGHSQAKFVVYPIGAPRADGLQLINWIADRRVREPVPGLTALRQAKVRPNAPAKTDERV